MTVAGALAGSIDEGMVILVGIEPADTAEDVERAVEKLAGLRIFPDERGLMNRSILDIGGSALVVSQFTLLGDVRRGRRPSFTGAAGPDVAQPLVDQLVASMRAAGVTIETGVFGALMEVELVNDGPVTIVFDVTGASVQ